MVSICCKLMRALAAVVFLAAYATPQEELSSTLYSTIYGASVAFSNENVTFTCIARGSIGNHIGWSSDQYISAGGRRLEFISANTPGTTRTSGDTVAVLVQADENVIIESRLYIRILPTIPIASVQCHNIAAGTVTPIRFSLAKNDTSVVCDKPSVCSGESVTCVCATGNSNSLAWVTDGNRIEFASNVPVGTRMNVMDSNAYGILTNRYNENRIQGISSNLTLTASVGDTSLLAKCENVDSSTSNPAIIPVTPIDNCPTSTSTSTTETTTSPGNEPNSNSQVVGPIVGVAILAVLVILLLPVCLILVIIAVYICSEISKKDDIIEEKENLISEKDVEIEGLKIEKKNLTATISDQDSEIERLKEDNKSLTATISGKSKEIKNKDKEIRNMTKDIESLNGTIVENTTKISGLEREISEKDEMIRTLEASEETNKKLTSDNAKLKGQLQRKKDEAKQLKKDLDAANLKLKSGVTIASPHAIGGD